MKSVLTTLATALLSIGLLAEQGQQPTRETIQQNTPVKNPASDENLREPIPPIRDETQTPGFAQNAAPTVNFDDALDRALEPEHRVEILKRVFPFGRADARYAPALLKLLQQSDAPGVVRRQAGELLLRGEISAAYAVILQMRTDALQPAEWRSECIGLIAFQYGRTKSRECLNILWTTLDSKIETLAARAFEELVQISERELWKDSNKEGETRLKRASQSALNEYYPEMIVSVCRATAFAKWTDLIPAIESLAAAPHASHELRLEAIESLKRFHRTDSVVVLRDLAFCSDKIIAKAAREALPFAEIGGTDKISEALNAEWSADGVPAAEHALRLNNPFTDTLRPRTLLFSHILQPRALVPIDTTDVTGAKVMTEGATSRVHLPAKFGQIRGPLEYILVRSGSEEQHEALLVTDVSQAELRAALATLKAQPVDAQRRNGFVPLGENAPLVLSVQFAVPEDIAASTGISALRVPVEAFIRHENEAWSMPTTPWFHALTSRSSKNASTRELIALMDDRAALIQNATPIAEKANVVEGAGLFLAHHALCPAKGTPCTLVIEKSNTHAPLPPIHSQRALNTRELAEMLAYPLPTEVRLQLAQLLSMSTGDKDARRRLLAIFASNTETTAIRQQLAEVLIHWHTPEIYPLIEKNLDNELCGLNWRSRLLEIFAFDYSRTLRVESVDAILDRTDAKVDPSLRGIALACCARLAFSQGWRTTDTPRFDRLLHALEEAFKSSDATTLKAACFAVAELRLSQYYAQLDACASDAQHSDAVRAEALWALRVSSRKQSAQILDTAAKSESKLIQWTAQAALPFALAESLSLEASHATLAQLKSMGERAWPALYTFLDRHTRNTSKPFVKNLLSTQQLNGLPDTSAAPPSDVANPLQFDARTGVIRMKGVFANESAPAEYIAVGKGSSEEHEALLVVDSLPSELNRVLKALGYIAANADSRADGRLPMDPLSSFALYVEYQDETGKAIRAPVESYIRRQDRYKPLTRDAWIFTGSRMGRERSGKEILRADINRFAIAFTHDVDAVLNCANEDAMHANVADGEASFVLNQPLIPKKGHPCWLVLDPWFNKPSTGEQQK